MGYGCEVVLDSVGPNDARITTFEVTFPRIVLAEFNTHRVFSRNSASSRAIPTAKQLAKVEDDPFIPVHWGKNQKGMSADEELQPAQIGGALAVWKIARDSSLHFAKNLLDIGVHKQITNRLLEPFMWHTVIVTSTHWDNYENLRDSKKAQPEIKDSAHALKEARCASVPQDLYYGEWHLPLVSGVDELSLVEEGFTTEDLVKISAARCARVSYLTHEGKRDPRDDLRLYGDLLANRHMSPFEHPAMALTTAAWEALARTQLTEWTHRKIPTGNYWGWLQHRKTIESEDVANPE